MGLGPDGIDEIDDPGAGWVYTLGGVQAQIVIAGDTRRRGELIAAVQRAGFDVHTCPAGGVHRALRDDITPLALIVCIDDADRDVVATAVAEARRHSASVPVLVHAALGGDQARMADLLTLNADAFVEAPVDAVAVAQVLRDVIGSAQDDAMHPRGRADTDKNPVAVADSRRLSAPSWQGGESGLGSSETTDPLPARGPWHRTLDRLEARMLGDGESAGVVSADESADDIDLSSLGVDSIPPVDAHADDEADAAASGVRLRLSGLGPGGVVDAEVTAPAPSLVGPVFDMTERIGDRDRALSTEATGTGVTVYAQHVVPGQRHSVSEAGLIARVCAPELLWRLATERFTGSITFTRRGTQTRAWLVDGVLVHARGEAPSDAFIDGLVRRGRLTTPHARHARALRGKGFDEFVRALVDLNYLKRREAEALVVDHLRRVVDATFAWDDGDWVLGHGERTEDELDVPLDVHALVVNGCRWRISVATLRERLADAGRVPVMAGDATPLQRANAVALERLELDEVERVEVARLDGRRTLDEIATAPTGDPRRSLALIYVLRLAGQLAWLDEPRPAVDDEAIDLDMLRIRERLMLARAGDCFALLGLRRDPSDGDVARAYADASALVARDRLEPAVGDRLADEIAELSAAFERAAESLADSAGRRRHLEQLSRRSTT